nr:1-acyl-sn-glycerol-3-phosphate acyltransferase [Opitutaceae bacterium]
MPTPLIKRRSYLPAFWEIIAATVARLLYRVRYHGAEGIPATGGVLLVANHLSYVDPVVLQMACPRPIRFIGHKSLRENGFFDWVFRLSGVIPIASKNPTDAMRRAIRALEAGEVVAIFPEGHISRTGQLMAIQRGFEVIARRAQVPVVPAFIDGVWGSVFSFAGNTYLWKSPRLMPTPVFVQFGAPIAPAQAEPAYIRKLLLDLGAAAFEERPVLRRHLGRECMRSLVKHPGHVAIVDRTVERREVRGGQLAAIAAALSRHIRKTIPEKRVGIVLPPGAGAFIANLAIISAGKIPVNLNFTAGKPALEASMKIGGVSTVLTAEAVRQKVPQFPWPERTLDLRAEIAAMGGKRAILPWLAAAWLLPNQWFANLLGLPKIGDRAEAGLLF